ncbi:hypothetical protein [Streptomyces minutiscleroticus]|uniref:hypothetical protein n=1 Tax=Streptomyces minutiscleroticus TaxID=68238 RepID=UPI0033235F37
MSAAAPTRVSRFYTAARRHPWVLGKVADWRIPLGPYSPAQIALAVVGGFVLVKTIPVWSWMGPVPVVAWLLAIWAVRRPKIAGRAPLQAALGWTLLLRQPHGGRIGGRAARDRAARPLAGGFVLEELAAATAATPAASRLAGRSSRRAARPRRSASRWMRQARSPQTQPVAGARPVSGVQQLLARAAQKEGGV